MVAAETDTVESRLDWDKADLHPLFVSGHMLVVSGVATVPMTVRLQLQPLGIAPEDYRGLEVLGKPSGIGPQVESPWGVQIETKSLSGRIGFVLLGATKQKYFPPK